MKKIDSNINCSLSFSPFFLSYPVESSSHLSSREDLEVLFGANVSDERMWKVLLQTDSIVVWKMEKEEGRGSN